MSDEFNDMAHLALFTDVYTGGAVCTSVPQIPSQASASGPKQRRRRKKAKKETEINGAFGKKRKLSDEQVKMLERSFESDYKLELERKEKLAAELGLEPKQVAVWFQNRRARWRSKKLEDEYSRLRSEHEDVVRHKCGLETQVSKLNEELNEAQKEIERLRCNNNNSPTTSSSLTMSMDTNTNNNVNVNVNVVDPASLFDMHVGADFNFDTSNFIGLQEEDYYIPAFDVWASTLYTM